MTVAGLDLALLALLSLAGLVAGFINTLAGGGSLLTLPALMALGLPADIANGTNRLAVATQAATGTFRFHREGKLDTKALPEIAPPTVAGALLGALAASYFPERYLKPVLLGTMVAMALIMTLRPSAIAPEGATPKRATEHVPAWLGLFAAGLYGGFVQAGVGFVLLTVLAGMLHYDLVRANALKLLVTLGFGIVALGVFAVRGQVAWLPATVLAVATSCGSLLGVRYAVKADPKALKVLVLVLVVFACGAALLEELLA